MILILSSLMVFALMLFLFKDFRAACSILFIAVLGIAGSLIALYHDKYAPQCRKLYRIDYDSWNYREDAIFTFQQFNTNREKGTVDELVYAISTRLRPKLMTALGAIIALLPLAILALALGHRCINPLQLQSSADSLLLFLFF